MTFTKKKFSKKKYKLIMKNLVLTTEKYISNDYLSVITKEKFDSNYDGNSSKIPENINIDFSLVGKKINDGQFKIDDLIEFEIFLENLNIVSEWKSISTDGKSQKSHYEIEL